MMAMSHMIAAINQYDEMGDDGIGGSFELLKY